MTNPETARGRYGSTARTKEGHMPPDEPMGNGAPQASKGEGGTPQGVTVEQVNEIVSKAISARNKQFDSKIEKSFADLTAGLGDLISSKLEGLTKPNDTPPKPGDETPQMKAMQKQLADMQKKLDAAESEKQASTQRARDKDLRQKLTESLTSAGITGPALKGAIATLVDGEKRVRMDDEGERVLFRGDEGDDLPLADGLKGWLKSDDAKIYLPPRGVGGSGQQPGGGNALRPGDKNNATTAAAELLVRHLGGGL